MLKKPTKGICIPFAVDDNSIFEAINKTKHQILLWDDQAIVILQILLPSVHLYLKK